MHDNTQLISLKIGHSGLSSFVMADQAYEIIKKGSWNPVYLVRSQAEEILKCSYPFWGSTGKVRFNDGSIYQVKYSNQPYFKLSFIDGDNEILSYGLTLGKNKPVITFSVSNSLVDAEKVLILAALGKKLIYGKFHAACNADDNDSFLLLTSAASS
jgi:hypothetical protein